MEKKFGRFNFGSILLFQRQDNNVSCRCTIEVHFN